MKYGITALLYFVLITAISPATARIKTGTGPDLGIKLGANFNQINGDYWEKGYKTNFMGGAYFGVNGKRMGIQIEGLFSQHTYTTGSGFRSLYQDAINPNNYKDSNGTFRVSLLQIPILLNIKLFPSVRLQAGPQYSGIVSVTDKNDFLKDAKSLFDSGWDGVVGLNIRLPLGLNAGVRYIFGLSDINNSSFNNPYTGKAIEDAWKQRTIQVHIGLSFL